MWAMGMLTITIPRAAYYVINHDFLADQDLRLHDGLRRLRIFTYFYNHEADCSHFVRPRIRLGIRRRPPGVKCWLDGDLPEETWQVIVGEEYEEAVIDWGEAEGRAA